MIPARSAATRFIDLDERDDRAVRVRASPSSLRPHEPGSLPEARLGDRLDVEVVVTPHATRTARTRRSRVCASEMTNAPSTEEGAFDGEIRRRPTLPGGLPPSTIGADSLNFRVRDGNGCDPVAMATGNLLSRMRFRTVGAKPNGRSSPPSTPEQARAMFKPSPRPISTGRLSTLPYVHLRPINVMVLSRALLR